MDGVASVGVDRLSGLQDINCSASLVNSTDKKEGLGILRDLSHRKTFSQRYWKDGAKETGQTYLSMVLFERIELACFFI
jgi:hypothetical protein